MKSKKTKKRPGLLTAKKGAIRGDFGSHDRITHKRAVRQYRLKRHTDGSPVITENFSDHCSKMLEDHTYTYALLGMLSDSDMRELVELWANEVSGRAKMMAQLEPNAGHEEVASSGAEKICNDFERHLKKRGDRFKLAMNMMGAVLQFGYLGTDLKWLLNDTLGYFHLECPDLLGA